MGTLVAKAYATAMVAGLADHTYVECGAGARGWGCWGRKTGGNAIASGIGSTVRADAIAAADEKAGITCYGINGVCHQAANRILIESGQLVTRARGYWVSDAIFGPYGRPRPILGMCAAPFYRHDGMTGDLPECVGSPPSAKRIAPRKAGIPSDHLLRYARLAADDLAQAGGTDAALGVDEMLAFSRRAFARMIEHRMPKTFAPKRAALLHERRASFEGHRVDAETLLVQRARSATDFANSLNSLTLQFQADVANTLTEQQYKRFLGLGRDEPVVLIEPDVFAQRWESQHAGG